MRLPSANQHKFAENPNIHIPRSVFNRVHSNSLTFDSSYLVPFFHDGDILPGDTVNIRASIFARLNTPYFPIMTNVWMMVHFWAVPYRLLWRHWVNLMGEKDDPDDTTTYMTPQSVIPAGGYFTHSLQDYFGLPVREISPSTPTPPFSYITKAGVSHNVFLTRAYNFTWNYAYRDQNLQDRVPFSDGDGPDAPADYVLLRRGKRHDYFTSCLPWPQKGDPVGISLTGNAPLVFPTGIAGTAAMTSATRITGALSPQSLGNLIIANGDNKLITANSAIASGGSVRLDGTLNITTPTNSYADMSNLAALTINQFRSAFLTQELLEIDARGGTRYPEMIQAHFGVTNPDARMQYPEWLGGDTTLLRITSVPQTSETTADSPQANLAAFGTFQKHGLGFVKSFTEHSVIFGLLCVYADLTYSQGLHRHWSRRTRYDFYAPVFANLGEQAVLNKEIYAQGTAGGSDDNDTFGYQERWAEYRYMPNRVTGLFRPGVPGSLSSWNLSQYFTDLPQLSSDFIEENVPMDRVVVVQDEPDFKADTYVEMTHVRPMPVRSIPVKLGGSGRRMF